MEKCDRKIKRFLLFIYGIFYFSEKCTRFAGNNLKLSWTIHGCCLFTCIEPDQSKSPAITAAHLTRFRRYPVSEAKGQRSEGVAVNDSAAKRIPGGNLQKIRTGRDRFSGCPKLLFHTRGSGSRSTPISALSLISEYLHTTTATDRPVTGDPEQGKKTLRSSAN